MGRFWAAVLQDNKRKMSQIEQSRAQMTVSGRVQGVFYRHSAREKAESLGLCGWVKNLPDGNVLLEAFGPRQAVEELIVWCRKGPPSARVDNVAVQWLPPDEPKKSSFDIAY